LAAGAALPAVFSTNLVVSMAAPVAVPAVPVGAGASARARHPVTVTELAAAAVPVVGGVCASPAGGVCADTVTSAQAKTASAPDSVRFIEVSFFIFIA
jgi:hypothetical protein